MSICRALRAGQGCRSSSIWSVYTGGGPAHTNWKNFGENVPERLDRLIGSGAMPPVVVAFPDCFTKLGGNQYINSAAMGAWTDFLVQEAVPYVEKEFHCGGDGRRAVFGKSSGGYGAAVNAMLRPDFWAAAACHSGDMGFETAYLPPLVAMLPALAKAGGVRAWLENFSPSPRPKTRMSSAWKCWHVRQLRSGPEGVHGRAPATRPRNGRTAARTLGEFRALGSCEHGREPGAALGKLKALYVDCGDV